MTAASMNDCTTSAARWNNSAEIMAARQQPEDVKTISSLATLVEQAKSVENANAASY